MSRLVAIIKLCCGGLYCPAWVPVIGMILNFYLGCLRGERHGFGNQKPLLSKIGWVCNEPYQVLLPVPGIVLF